MGYCSFEFESFTPAIITIIMTMNENDEKHTQKATHTHGFYSIQKDVFRLILYSYHWMVDL